MNTLMENMTGMNRLTDQVIATDFLMAAKSGVKMYAIAITETASPQIRTMLRGHLQDNIEAHEQITGYMMSKGYYNPYDVREQIKVDLQASQNALGAANG